MSVAGEKCVRSYDQTSRGAHDDDASAPLYLGETGTGPTVRLSGPGSGRHKRHEVVLVIGELLGEQSLL